MTFYQKTLLDNGTVVVTEKVPDVRSVAIGFWVNVGSRNESDKESGMSHFIEHMMFKGTKTRSAKDISETFDSLGAELNAFTTKEFTCYYSRLIDEHIDVGVEVLTDMLQNSLLNEEHIDFEKQVVLEEIAMYEDTPDELIHELFTSTLWENHPLGRQVLGSRETVGSFDRAKVVAFMHKYYTSGNIIISAAGNLDHEKLVDLVKKYYKPEALKKPDQVTEKPKIKQIVNVYTKKTEQVHICYGTEALNSRHKDRFALSLLENILGGGMSSRLFQKIREERGLAYSVYSYHSLYKDSGNLAIYVGTRLANVNEVLSIIRNEISSIRENGATRDELDRAREHLKGQMVLGLESTRNRMTRLGRSEMTQGEILSVNQLVDRINAVTLEDIMKLAANIFQQDRQILTVIGSIEEKDLVL